MRKHGQNGSAIIAQPFTNLGSIHIKPPSINFEIFDAEFSALLKTTFEDAAARVYERELAPKIADEFIRQLAKTLTERQMQLVRSRNRKEKDSNCCHSHDFCDANVVMDDAFRIAVGRRSRTQSDADCNLWSVAWDIAKRKEFKC